MGLVAGYRGGLIDELIMRLADIILAFPVLLLYMIIIAAVGPSAFNIIFAVTFASSPAIARIVQRLVLGSRAASSWRRRGSGRSAWYIMLVEILPNAKGPLIVDTCIQVGYVAFTMGRSASSGSASARRPPAGAAWSTPPATGSSSPPG